MRFTSLALLYCCGALAAETDLPEVRVQESVTPTLRYQLPQTAESISAQQIGETVNALDSEDALKYVPSLFVRKRNAGDTQPVLATRTWGMNASARSLVYADGVLLSALIANNNSIGAPRWGLVAPEEIERIDVLYGPFAAAFPGNAMGAVVDITTRLPKKFEASLSQTEAWQSFSQYGTRDTYRSSQTAATLGDRSGDLAWWLSFNHQDSHSQPLSYVTAASQPALTTGGYGDRSKTGSIANVYGATGLLHTVMDNTKLKLAYDLTPTLRASYVFGLWSNDGHAGAQTYLRTAAGAPTYGNQNGFGSGQYTLQQQHSMHSLSLASRTGGAWDWEAVATRYSVDHDIQRTPNAVGAGLALPATGRIALLEGTGWNTLDVKGNWRGTRDHELSFGYHHDRYALANVTWNTSTWSTGRDFASRFSEGDGKTETHALWAQDAWRFAPDLKATLGGRWETWRAFDGYNYSVTGNTSVSQPALDAKRFSPKASLAWSASDDSLVTAALAQAYRFPTAAELYQQVVVGSQTVTPNPSLKPEDVLSAELAFEKQLTGGRLRLSLFNEEVRDALISQSTLDPATNTIATVTVNVDRVRATGFELAAQQNDVGIRCLELSASLTYVYSKIINNPQWRSTGGSVSTGKFAPYVPDWRATIVATYRASDKLGATLAARYSGRIWSTMDNSDVHGHAYQGFEGFFVVDAKLNYKLDAHWAASVGVDNLNNYKYTLFHPFPQRTWVGSLKYSY